ncbi:major facilitator superfamily transporter [Paraphaeosphaeria sporulosa]
MVFCGYAVLGVVKFVLALLLSSRVEVETPKKLTDANSSANTEGTPLLDDETGTAGDEPRAKVRMWTLLPEISREDQAVMMSTFDIIVEFWPHIAIILYRVCPTEHNFLYKFFRFGCITTFSSTIIGTKAVMWFFGSL